MKTVLLYSIVACISLSPLYIFSQEPGDVNNSDSIDIVDALLVAQYYVGLNPNNFNPDVADVNCDSSIDIVDALNIAQYSVGFTIELRECSEPPTPVTTLIPTEGPTFITSPTPTNPGTPMVTIEPSPTPEPVIIDEHILWQAMIGGNENDEAHSCQTTTDNGYILAGKSFSTDIEECMNHGDSDFYIVKYDADGNNEWQTMIGGNNYDEAISIQEIPDNGYIVAGISASTDIEGCTNHGEEDLYIVKLDISGSVEWQTMIGGNDSDGAISIRITPDNGYLIAGFSRSTDIPGCVNQGEEDLFIVKLNTAGTIEWQTMTGGNADDGPFAIEITPDNGSIIAGIACSTDIEGCVNRGYEDYYIVKLDAAGTVQWQTMTGGNSEDLITSFQIIPNNGCIISGYSDSTDIQGCINHGDVDLYMVKLDDNGSIEWQKMVGGNAQDEAYSMVITPDNDYVLVGNSYSNDIQGCINHGEGDFYAVKLDENGTTEWQKMLGGSGIEDAQSIHLTPGNNYIITGWSGSTDIPGCINHGAYDFYVVKLNIDGESVWQDMIGGNNFDEATSIIAAQDGGYILSGRSESTDITNCTNSGKKDLYIVKLALNENILWQKMYGGNGDDINRSIRITSANGYILAGGSDSSDIEGCINNGYRDILVTKLDVNGNIAWQKMYGGSDAEEAYSIQVTPDGGFILAGYSGSTDIDGCNNQGNNDFYVLKLDATGTIEWQKMFGGSGVEEVYSLRITPDNGYILAGMSVSTDIEGCINQGESDIYVVKLDASGTIEWQKMLGGSNRDEATSIRITQDDGYIIAGLSSSTDIEGIVNQGGVDFYIVKLNASGTVEWQKMFGGSDYDIAASVRITPDNDYIIAGTSYSTDIEGCNSNGYIDVYIIKLDTNGDMIWQKMLGGSDYDGANSIQITPDNNYVVAGASSSTDIPGCINHGNSDYYIIKLDADGNTKGEEMFGGNYSDTAYSILATPDNDYVVAGYSGSPDIGGCLNHNGYDIYIVKLNDIGGYAVNETIE